jgi:hypothetical protein
VSGLWTPGDPQSGAGTGSGSSAGAGDPGPDPGQDTRLTDAGQPSEADEAALAEELQRVRAELASTPVADIVANHAVGLWQLAVLHLTPEEGELPRLDEAGLAIDAMAGLIEPLGDRLGANAEALRDALAQLRLAYVQVRDSVDPSQAPNPAPNPAAGETAVDD